MIISVYIFIHLVCLSVPLSLCQFLFFRFLSVSLSFPSLPLSISSSFSHSSSPFLSLLLALSLTPPRPFSHSSSPFLSLLLALSLTPSIILSVFLFSPFPLSRPFSILLLLKLSLLLSFWVRFPPQAFPVFLSPQPWGNVSDLYFRGYEFDSKHVLMLQIFSEI